MCVYAAGTRTIGVLICGERQTEFVCVYVCLYVCVFKCICIYTCVCMCMRVCVCVYCRDKNDHDTHL